ncbi:MAG: Site-specific recombinase, partial [Propionibacteriaceae bacterium]|nr:Site-specific recombinase [Propionibacteriaceae bacterium]
LAKLAGARMAWRDSTQPGAVPPPSGPGPVDEPSACRHAEEMNQLLVGDARVSTEHQDLTAQRDGLAALGVSDDRI